MVKTKDFKEPSECFNVLCELINMKLTLNHMQKQSSTHRNQSLDNKVVIMKVRLEVSGNSDI